MKERLDAIHRAACQGAGAVCAMIGRRRFNRVAAVEAVEKLKFATQELEALVAETDKDAR